MLKHRASLRHRANGEPSLLFLYTGRIYQTDSYGTIIFGTDLGEQFVPLACFGASADEAFNSTVEGLRALRSYELIADPTLIARSRLRCIRSDGAPLLTHFKLAAVPTPQVLAQVTAARGDAQVRVAVGAGVGSPLWRNWSRDSTLVVDGLPDDIRAAQAAAEDDGDPEDGFFWVEQ